VAATTSTPESVPLDQLPPGKLRCVITEKLRQDTPEEHVRQRVARSLLETYGYDRADIEVEFTIKAGSAKGKKKPRIDLAIFRPGASHEQENVFIAIECKRDNVRPSDIKEGTEQLCSYMAICLNCQYGMWFGSSFHVIEKVQVTRGGRSEFEYQDASDIPRRGQSSPAALKFQDLVPAREDELPVVFKRCHDYIYGNQGFQKERAFHELVKVLFCKVWDEETSRGPVRFYIGNADRRDEVGRRRLKKTIDDLFEQVKKKYAYIFRHDDIIELEPGVLAYVVTELQRFNLQDTRADAKGEAYQQLVGANLRGDRGEFFTPRNVCDMAVRMAFATYPKEEWTSLKVIDPACGTGGFLTSVLVLWRETILTAERSKRGGSLTKAVEETDRRLLDVARANLFGVDINPVLARSAQMNLVMHGDGSTNVYRANTLLPPGEWPSDPPNDLAKYVHLGEFDIVVTNPPFGSKVPVDDAHVLSQYELAQEGLEGEGRRGKRPPEQLFVERALELAKPGGRVAIVLPDSILSNPGLVFIRRWILRKARVLASISLPTVTFEPHTGTKTSVVILQKRQPHEERLIAGGGKTAEYKVFMATPRQVGHDRRSNPVYLRTPEGDIIEGEETRQIIRRQSDGSFKVETRHEKLPVIHDEIPEVVRYFEAWCQQNSRMEWING
jgi:type I restriction enzyme M protein